MVVDDIAALRKRLLSDAAAYSDVLIELGLPCVGRDARMVPGGFILAVSYPDGRASVTIEADSPATARKLLQMQPEALSLGCRFTSEAVAEKLAAEHSSPVRACSEEHVHYAIDPPRFRPHVLGRCDVERLPADDASRLLAFVASEKALRDDLDRFRGVEERIGSETSAFYMARLDGRDAGYIEISQAAESTPLWSVDNVYTTPASRGHGVAKELLTSATKDALASGLVPLYTVAAENVASMKTCEAVGYYRCLDRWTICLSDA